MIEFLAKEVAKKDEELRDANIAYDHENHRADSNQEEVGKLTKELAKRDQEVKSLSIALDSKKGLCKDLEKLSDMRLEELVLAGDNLGDAEANLHWVEEKLSEMTKEKDLWKSEALEYRDKEKQWWAEEEKLKSSIVSINQDRIKVVGELEDKIKSLNDKYSKAWATDFAYNHLKKAYEDNNSYYEERIAKLHVEINHLKNNK